MSVIYIDINAISLCLDLNIFQQDECFCSKLGMEVEYAIKSNIKTSLSLIWAICHLLPFVRVWQYIHVQVKPANSGHSRETEKIAVIDRWPLFTGYNFRGGGGGGGTFWCSHEAGDRRLLTTFSLSIHRGMHRHMRTHTQTCISCIVGVPLLFSTILFQAMSDINLGLNDHS